MHGRKGSDVSKDKGEVVSSNGDHPFSGSDEHQESKRLASNLTKAFLFLDNLISSMYFKRIGIF